MSLGAKVLCFSTETNGLVEVLHCSELRVPSAQLGGEFVQTYQPMRGFSWIEANCFSAETNGLVEVFHGSKLVVSSPEMDCKPSQTVRSL